MTLPSYVYVASSWRNPTQPAVVSTLRAAGIDCYDFRNPEGGTGFSWSEVRSPDAPMRTATCEHCSGPLALSSFTGLGFYEPDVNPTDDPVVWRHAASGYARCTGGRTAAIPAKGSDWETVDEYLRMVAHPRALAGYASDFAAMERADTFVMVLPCGKSAHLEIGYAIGAGKRTAILLEDPVEPELMYRGADLLARDAHELLAWMGVQD